MELRHAPAWGGVDTSSASGSETDYDRACRVADYVGKLSVGSGEIIVFGDEPNQTALVRLSEHDVVLVRWRWAPSEDVVASYLRDLDPNLFHSTDETVIEFAQGDLVLFDASFDGSHIEESLTVQVAPGRYRIQTVMYEPSEETSLLLHRMVAAP